jgi:hypothetical protein
MTMTEDKHLVDGKRFVEDNHLTDSNHSSHSNEITYDENVKKFLSQKIILAHILVHTVKEFKGMIPEEVVPYIEGEPEVSRQRVFPEGTALEDFVQSDSAVVKGKDFVQSGSAEITGKKFVQSGATMITGMNSEDASRQEGTIYYDIRFYVIVPGTKDRIKLIIDIEAQNKLSDLGYDIITRGVYYCARMLSEQKGREFVKSNYDDIKKVYSIWIGVNCPEGKKNTITEFSIKQQNIVGNYPDTSRYDLLSVIFVGLSDDIADERDEYRLHRLLETFFSESLDEHQKREVIESEYGIEYSTDMERSVKEMCNVSQGLIEKGETRGRIEGERRGRIEGERRGRIEGQKRGKIEAYLDVGKDEEYIAEKLGITIEEVQRIAQTLEHEQI